MRLRLRSGSMTTLRSKSSRFRLGFNGLPSLLILLVLMVYPLLTLFVQIVFPGMFNVKMDFHPSLGAFFQVFTNQDDLQAVGNSFFIGILAAIVSTIFGVITAFASANASPRTKRLIDVGIWVVFFAPSYVIAQGWIELMQDGGIFAHVFHLQNGWSAWFFSKFGLIIAMGFRYFPFVHMAMQQAIGNLGTDLLRAARMSGAKRATLFRKITLPLLTPAILAGATIAFAEGFGDFGFAAAITPTTHIPLMAYQIYVALNQSPVDYAAAAALSLLLVVVTGGALLLQMWWMNRRSYVTVSSGSSLTTSSDSPAKWVIWAGFAILFIALVLPFGGTLIQSFLKSDAMTLTASSWTVKHYVEVITGHTHLAQNSVHGMLRSIIYSLVAAICTMIFALFVAYQLVFSKSKANRILNAFLMGTIAVPGVVLAASYIFAWNATWLIPLHLVLYGTPLCLAMAYVAGHLPYAVRLQMGSLSQVSGNLVTAARILGASESRVVRRIVLPLVSVATVSTFFLTFTDTVFELPASSLLYPAGGPPFPVVVQQAFNAFDYGKGSAMAILGMVIIFGFYLLGQWIAWRFEKSGTVVSPRQPAAHSVETSESTPSVLLNS